jgi:hypothetical protein
VEVTPEAVLQSFTLLIVIGINGCLKIQDGIVLKIQDVKPHSLTQISLGNEVLKIQDSGIHK